MNLKKVDALLVQKSINAARLRGDDYNGVLFARMAGRKLTEAERRSCNMYLWGADMFHKTIEDLEALP
jgi:hypothetical protein